MPAILTGHPGAPHPVSCVPFVLEVLAKVCLQGLLPDFRESFYNAVPLM